jgi:hypothetical protein
MEEVLVTSYGAFDRLDAERTILASVNPGASDSAKRCALTKSGLCEDLNVLWRAV